MAVAPDAFREWMTPHVVAIRDLAVAIEAVPERFGELPGAASRAMSELAEEQEYSKRSSWERPITDTHTFGAMTLRAASDYLRGFAELFESGDPPCQGRSKSDPLAPVEKWTTRSGLGSGREWSEGA